VLGRQYGCGGGLLCKDTVFCLVVSLLVLACHLHWLGTEYILFVMDYRIEVTVGIVFKYTLSKSSISNGLVPAE
jgi:hypothetical protein